MLPPGRRSNIRNCFQRRQSKTNGALPLNRLTQDLSQVCQDYLFEEKWLIAPSLRVGRQWLDNVAKNGQPILNARVKTLKSMALGLAASEMTARGLSLVPGRGALILVDRVLNRLRKDPSSYLSSLPSSPNLPATMLSALEALRLAGVGPEDLRGELFEVAQKAADLSWLLTEYFAALRENKIADYCDVLEMAVARLNADPSIMARVLVLIPEDSTLTAMERDLMANLPSGSRRVLSVDRAEQAELHQPLTDADLLRWVRNPADAPEPVGDGTAEIFHAAGETNEIREALRRCLSAGYRLDEVELLHTDAETYVPLVFETLMRLVPDPQFDDISLPVTFAEGIPTRFSRPGRALAAWMAWMRQGYPQATLVRMIQEGLLEIPEADSENISHVVLGGALRDVGIGMGRENYLPQLERKMSALESQISGHSSTLPEDFLDGTSRQPSDKPDFSILNALFKLVERLLQLSPELEVADKELLEAAATFLQKIARSANELDNYSAQALLEAIQENLSWVGDEPEPLTMNMRDWLESLPNQVRVGGSGPRPGCLHVAHVQSGGHSGRKHTFIVGLDDSRFPGAGLSDPLLLDAEREKLSRDLPQASKELGLKLERFALLLARLRGNVTLGFSCLDLQDDRDMFAGPVILAAYRILSSNREGDQAGMTQWLGQPASFAPDEADRCLEEADWWLWRMCGSNRASNAMEIVEARFPHLGRGVTAARAREAAEFTVYDGLLRAPPPELDPTSPSGPVVSASRLETIGQCPLRYFFKYVLGIKAPGELEVDRRTWLAPGLFGDLLHEVFYEFMSGLIGEGRLPNYTRDIGPLLRILDERVQRYARLHPPPTQFALHRQIELLTQAARIFLVEEEELCRHSRPVFLEAAIATKSDFPPSPLSSDRPVRLKLPGGGSINAQARIDRIDVTGSDADQVYTIWDYKSGSAWKYEKPDPFWQGRVVQHALYLEVAAAILKRKVSQKAEVSHSGFFFPGRAARGLRIRRWREQMSAAAKIIENLCKIAATGCFLATNNYEEDCAFCDYLMICGDVKEVAASAKRKLESAQNAILEPVRELRNIGR